VIATHEWHSFFDTTRSMASSSRQAARIMGLDPLPTMSFEPPLADPAESPPE
jgi:hypothetical protein